MLTIYDRTASAESIREQGISTPTLDSYELYEKFYWRYTHPASDANPLQDLHQACHYLCLAAMSGHREARSLLRGSNLRAPFEHELTETAETEFLFRLQDIMPSSPRYLEAQALLFMLYYSKRYHTVYADYQERAKELQLAFSHLMQVQSDTTQLLHPIIKTFAKKMLPGYPEAVSAETLESAARTTLAMELNGRDPLAEISQAHSAKKLPSYSPLPDYPFRLLPHERLEAFYDQAPQGVLSELKDFKRDVAQITKMYCSARATRGYQLTIATEQLKKASKLICFIDKKQGIEIARLKVTSQGVFFKAYGDAIHLKIQGTIDIPILALENSSSDVTLTANWHTEQPIYLAASVKRLVYKGQMQSTQPVRVNVQGEMDMVMGSEIRSLSQIGLQATTCYLRGKIHSQSYCQLQMQQALQLSPDSECTADQGVVISASVLKDIRGRVVSESFVKVEAEEGIYLHGAAELHGKTALVVKTKSLMSTDKASLRTEGQAQVEATDQLTVDKESRWHGQSLVVRAKTFKNYSPYFSGKKVVIHSDNEATNYPSGVLTTEEALHMTGDSVWNGGRIQYGQQLQIKLNKLFVHGIVESSQFSELKRTTEQACIEGGDANVIAGAVITVLGSMKVKTWAISAIAEINLGLTVAKSSRKTRLIALDFGIDLPHVSQIYQDIGRFTGAVQQGDFRRAFGMISFWDGVVNVSSFTRWTLRNFLPGISKVVDAGWSTLIFIISVPKVYQEYRNLYKRGRKVESSDIYALLATSSNLATQAISLVPQEQAAIQELQENHFNSAGAQPLEILIPSLALDFVTLFMPVSSDDAVFEAKVGGFHGGASLLSRTGFSYDLASMQLGLSITDMFIYSKQYAGVRAAGHVSEIGREVNHTNTVAVGLTASTNVVKQTELGTVVAGEVDWQSTSLREKANVIGDVVRISTQSPFDHRGSFWSGRMLSIDAPSFTMRGGSIDTEEIHLKEDHVSDLDDLLLEKGIYSGIHVRQGGLLSVETKDNVVFNQKMDFPSYGVMVSGASINVNQNLHSDSTMGLYSTVGDITVKKGCEVSSQNMYVISQGKFCNQGTVIGTKTNVIYAQGDVVNTGGTLKGDTYLFVKSAKGDIKGICEEKNVKAKYDTKKEYQTAKFLGGTGEGHGGVGLYMEAGGQVILDASEIKSTGDNFVYGHGGIQVKARSHKYVSFYRHDETWYGKEYENKETDTQIQGSSIYSAKGKNTFLMDPGKQMYSCAAEFLTPNGSSDFVGVEGQFHFAKLEAKHTQTKNSSNFFGLDGDKSFQQDAYEIPTTIAVIKGARIIAPGGNANLDGAVVIGHGKLEIDAKTVKLSDPIEDHYRVEETSGFGIKGPDIPSLVPLYQDYKVQARPQSAGERAANTWNTLVDGVNTGNSLVGAARNGFPLQAIFPISSMTMGEVDYSHTQTRFHWQAVAPGFGIQMDSLSINAETVEFSNGVPVIISGDASIHAKTFIQNGAVLHSSMSTHTEGVSAGLSAQGDINLSAGISRGGYQATTYANQNFWVKGTLDIEVDDWRMDSANTVAGKLTGHAGSITVISCSDKTTSYGQSFQVSSNGYFAYQNGSERSAKVGTVSGLEVLGNAQFVVGPVNLFGGKLLFDDPASHVQIGPVTSKSVAEYSQGTSVGFCGNAYDLAGASSGRLWGQAIPTVNVQLAKQNYQASQLGTIWGAPGSNVSFQSVQGKLNTQNRDGLIVSRNESYDYEVKVPLYSAAGLQQGRENLSWLADQLHVSQAKSSVSDKPAYSLHQTEDEHTVQTPEEKKSGRKSASGNSLTDEEDPIIDEAEQTSAVVSKGLKQPIGVTGGQFTLFAHGDEDYSDDDSLISSWQNSDPSPSKWPMILGDAKEKPSVSFWDKQCFLYKVSTAGIKLFLQDFGTEAKQDVDDLLHGDLSAKGHAVLDLGEKTLGVASLFVGGPSGIVRAAEAKGILWVEKFGLWKGGVSGKVVTPQNLLSESLMRDRVYEQLGNIQIYSPNAAVALSDKYSGLIGAQLKADKVEIFQDGSTRYYGKFRPAKKSGDTIGSRFVTEYNPKTGNVMMWDENYDLTGNVNRIHLKNINGVAIEAPHFPATLKEELEKKPNYHL